MVVIRLFGCTIHFRKSNAIVYGRFNLLRRKILKCDIDKSKIGWYPRKHSREILAGLGYSEEKIDQLFADGVVGSSMI